MDKALRDKLKKYDDGEYVFDAIWGDWMIVMKLTPNTETTNKKSKIFNKKCTYMNQERASELEVIEFVHKFDQDIEVPKELDDILYYVGKDHTSAEYNKFKKYRIGEIVKADTNNLKEHWYKGIPFVYDSDAAFGMQSAPTHNSYSKHEYDETDMLHGDQTYLVEDLDNDLAYGYTYNYDHGICTSYEVRKFDLKYGWEDNAYGPRCTLISTTKGPKEGQ
jgi:hypothetical protein